MGGARRAATYVVWNLGPFLSMQFLHLSSPTEKTILRLLQHLYSKL